MHDEIANEIMAEYEKETKALRAENARLTKERDNALQRAAEYRYECNSLTNQNRALRAARAAMGESDANS